MLTRFKYLLRLFLVILLFIFCYGLIYPIFLLFMMISSPFFGWGRSYEWIRDRSFGVVETYSDLTVLDYILGAYLNAKGIVTGSSPSSVSEWKRDRKKLNIRKEWKGDRRMKEKKERLLECLWAVLNPYFWISSQKSCKNVDGYINKVIEEDLFESFGYNGGEMWEKDFYTFYTKDGKEIWIANYPYAYGWVVDRDKLNPFGGEVPSLLPFRKTRKKLKKYLEGKINI